MELEKALLGRGRVWHDCVPLLVALDRQTGNVAVNVEQPDPHEIKVNMVLYVMSQAEKGGYYVGEFRVVAVQDKKIELAPPSRSTRRRSRGWPRATSAARDGCCTRSCRSTSTWSLPT